MKDANSKETLEKISKIEKEVEQKVEELLQDEPRYMGFCHLYWRTKKRILKEDYGIDWLTPAESNPHIMLD